MLFFVVANLSGPKKLGLSISSVAQNAALRCSSLSSPEKMITFMLIGRIIYFDLRQSSMIWGQSKQMIEQAMTLLVRVESQRYFLAIEDVID